MFRSVRLLAIVFCCVVGLAFGSGAALAADPPPPTAQIELDKSNKARSKYNALHNRLTKLREQFEAGDGKRMLSTLKSAKKELDKSKKLDPSLDLSGEEAEIIAYGDIAAALVAKLETAKARDKALKKFESEAKKVDRLVKNAESGKSKNDEFEKKIEAAAAHLKSAVDADPDFDPSEGNARLEDFRTSYARAGKVYIVKSQTKLFESETKKLSSLIQKASRSKIEPEDFAAGVERAEASIEAIATGDPDFDLSEMKEQLVSLQNDFEVASTGRAEGVHLKAINKAIANLEGVITRSDYQVTRLDAKEREAIEAGAPVEIEDISKAWEGLTTSIETAKAEQPDMDLTAIEVRTEELDDITDELLSKNTDEAINLYFARQSAPVAKWIDDVSRNNQSGSFFEPSEFTEYATTLSALDTLLGKLETAYPDADQDDVRTEYAAMSEAFDIVSTKNGNVRSAYAYYKNSSGILSSFANFGRSDVSYYLDEIRGSGIQGFDVDELRERLANRDPNEGLSAAQDTIRNLAIIDEMASGTAFVDGIKQQIKTSNDSQRSIADRTKALDAAELLAALGQKFRPEDSRYPAMAEQVEKRQAKIQAENAERFASASTGPFHLENMDSIVFHTAPLTIGSEDTSLISDTFEAGEPIYGTAYLSKSILDLATDSDRPENVSLSFDIGGTECSGYARGKVAGLTRDEVGNTYIQFAMLPDVSSYEYEHENDAHLSFAHCQEVNAITGEEPVRVGLGLRNARTGETTGLSGKFTLKYSEDSEERIKPIVAKLQEMRLDATRLPVAQLDDPALESLMLENAQYVDGEPVRAVLSSKIWHIYKNELDIPIEKYIYGHVAVKTAEARCFFYQVTVEAAYTGGAYGAPRPDGPKSGAREIRCDNI